MSEIQSKPKDLADFLDANPPPRKVALLVADMLLKVAGERRRQDRMWGEQNHTMDKWLTILGEEYGEVCQAIGETVLPNRSKPEQGGYDNIMRELTHLAAVSVAMMECLERNRAQWGM